MLADLITISPEIQSGTPVFAKTRVPVKILFDYLKGGDTIDEFLHDYPSVNRNQVVELLALLYAKAIGFVQLYLNGQGNLHKTYCSGA